MKEESIKRKPIMVSTVKRNSYYNPEFLDSEALLQRFEPLMKSLYNMFSNYQGGFDTLEQKEDLKNQIVYEFLRLRNQFDPRRGVDFSGYIKFHLQHRVYHYVKKTLRVSMSEIPESDLVVTNYSDEDFPVQAEYKEEDDESTNREMRIVEAIASIPWEKVESELHKELIESVLIKRMTVEEFSKLKDLPISRVNALVTECCIMLEKICN